MTLKYLIPFTLFVLTITVIIQLNWFENTKTYIAYFEEPCGRSLLALQRPGKESIAVQVRGVNPIHELNHSVLVNTKLKISGYFTGRQIEDHHCGRYPEFYVTEYSAAGPVTRCSSVNDWLMHETLVVFPYGLAQNKFIDLDFEKHRSKLNEVSLSQCRQVDRNTVCKVNEAPAHVCGQTINWCCKT